MQHLRALLLGLAVAALGTSAEDFADEVQDAPDKGVAQASADPDFAGKFWDVRAPEDQSDGFSAGGAMHGTAAGTIEGFPGVNMTLVASYLCVDAEDVVACTNKHLEAADNPTALKELILEAAANPALKELIKRLRDISSALPEADLSAWRLKAEAEASLERWFDCVLVSAVMIFPSLQRLVLRFRGYGSTAVALWFAFGLIQSVVQSRPLVGFLVFAGYIEEHPGLLRGAPLVLLVRLLWFYCMALWTHGTAMPFAAFCLEFVAVLSIMITWTDLNQARHAQVQYPEEFAIIRVLRIVFGAFDLGRWLVRYCNASTLWYVQVGWVAAACITFWMGRYLFIAFARRFLRLDLVGLDLPAGPRFTMGMMARHEIKWGASELALLALSCYAAGSLGIPSWLCMLLNYIPLL